MFPEVNVMSEGSSEITVFVILLTTFILVTFLISRFGWFNESLPAVTMNVPTAAIEKVHNPFVISLINKKEASVEDGVTVKITSQVPCYIRVYWGMLVKDIYPLIHQQWDRYQQSLQDNIFKEFSLYSDEIIEVVPIRDKNFKLRPQSTEFTHEMGDPPRDRYPLVIIICHLRAVDEQFDESWRNQVISSVSMLHVKDDKCPGETSIIAQYVRTMCGKPCNLQQLYVTNSTPDGSTSESANQSEQCNDDNDDDQSELSSQCVVCLSELVTRAFLPCRHACVCDNCFTRLSHCPMCRTIISSSFRIHQTS